MRTTRLRTASATAAAAFTVALSFGSLSTTNAGAFVNQSADTSTMTAANGYSYCWKDRVCRVGSDGVTRCRVVYICRETQA